jgi:hypothetical protein
MTFYYYFKFVNNKYKLLNMANTRLILFLNDSFIKEKEWFLSHDSQKLAL